MQKILKQTSFLLGAQVLGRVIGFFYTIFLARNLGVSDFGLYSTALAYYSIALAVSDFGFNRFLIRELVSDHQNIPKLLLNTAFLRLMITSVLFAIFAMALYVLDLDKLRVSLTLLAVLAVLPQSLSITLDAVFVSLEKLQFSALAIVFWNISTAVLGILLVFSGFGSTGAVVALASGQLIYLLILAILAKREQVQIISEINLKYFQKIIFGSLPYGILAVLGLLYFRIDILLLSYIKGNFQAGLYGVAYKFLEAIVFVPSALATALFPTLTRLHNTNSKKIGSLYFDSIKILGIIGLVITGLYIIFLPEIIKLLLPNYLSSIEAIKILALAIPFIFIHIPGAQVFLSTDKYLKPVVLFSIFTLSFNVILNLIFIPKFGLIAASWITVLSEALSFLIFFKLLKVRVL